jgi:hypothetical protein
MHIAEASQGKRMIAGRNIRQDGKLTQIASQANTRSLPKHFRLSVFTGDDADKYYDIGKDQLFVTKAITVITQYPFVHLAKEFVSGLHRYL